ncbi:MAG: ferrous iron transport protein A [Acidobacteria bacterium]|nr:ferrous iron transport protein A [Acidobacteriota bacterium]
MQLTFNKEPLAAEASATENSSSLGDLRCGQAAILASLDVAEDLGRRLMELGFFPGSDVVAAGCAPGGDPRVYRVDGSEVALRIETARFLKIRPNSIRTVVPPKSHSSRP